MNDEVFSPGQVPIPDWAVIKAGMDDKQRGRAIAYGLLTGTVWHEVEYSDEPMPLRPVPPQPPPTTPEGILLEPGDRSNEDATQRVLDGSGFTRVRLVNYGITGDTPLTPEWFATPVEERQMHIDDFNPEAR